MMTNKTILITGGNGYVGTNLAAFFQKRGCQVYCSVLKSCGFDNEAILDITNLENVRVVLGKIKPDIVIHTAGLSSLNDCEKNPQKAELINFIGTKNLVDSLDSKAKFIFFSSDYVFDGMEGDYKETDKTSPKTFYGKTKLKAEKYIKKNLSDYIIVRTANVFGRGGNFFTFVVDSVSNNQSIDVYDDVFFTPTPIDFLTDSVYRLLLIDFKGIIHLAGKDRLTRYEFAVKIADELGKKKLIKRSQSGGGLIAKDSSLNTTFLSSIIDNYCPSIEEAIHFTLNCHDLPYFKFEDDRGKILGISQGQAWQEVNYLESRKDCVRGNHYHKKAVEAFYIIEGTIEVTLEDINDKIRKVFIAEKGSIFTILPNILHTFRIITDSKWINMLSLPMSDKKKDIFKP